MIWTLASLLLPVAVALVADARGLPIALVAGVVGALALQSALQARLDAATRPRRAGPDAADPASVTEDGPRWLDPVRTVRERVTGWADEADQAAYERVRNNLRLMALTELWSSVSADDPDGALHERVVDFCRREAGLHEVAVLRLDPRALEIHGTWTRPHEDGRARSQSVRWAAAGVEGTVTRALRSTKVVRGSAADGKPLLRVNGERPRVAGHDGEHAVLPLVSPAPQPECLEQGWLFRPGCPAHRPNPESLARTRHSEPSRDLDLGPCGSCVHFPVRGVLVVTDAGAERPLSSPNLKLLEVLATTIASVLEHAQLYRDMKSAERFRDQVLDAMLNGLLSTDQHGRVVYANQRARELFAHAPLEGRRLDECVSLPGGSGALTRTLVEGKAYLQADGAANRQDEKGAIERIPVRVNLTPLRPEDGGMTGAVCVMEDRTVVRAMEQEIRHLDTLAAIGRFASSLAHELRNPLGGISAGVEFLARDLGRHQRLDDDTRENIQVIESEITRLDGILRNLLSVARPREMVLTECDPASLVHRAVSAFSALAQTLSIQLRVQTPGPLEPVHADADMIHQVLVNLLKNAIEASPSPSVVDVVLDARRDPVEDEHSDGITIEVLDRGPGIAEDDLPRIFEPFFSRKSNGTGLGLYVCHGFVQRHDGRLHAYARHGGGTRFVLELPRVPALMGGLHATSHSGGR